MSKSAYAFLMIIILMGFGCSSTTNDLATQDLETIKVEPLPPASQIPDPEALTSELFVNQKTIQTDTNPYIKRIKINEQITDEMIVQGRDLSAYDLADISSCKRYSCEERAAKEFIWQHWKNKKRGYFKGLYIQGIDFHGTTYIFIEPNNQNEWVINWKYVYRGSNNLIMDFLGIVSVNRITSKNGKSTLEFKDKDGVKIHSGTLF